MHRILSAGALALVLSSAAYADDASSSAQPSVCYSEATLAADAPAHGFKEVGAIQFHGDNWDEEIVLQGAASVVAFLFKDGCLAGQIHLDSVSDKPA